MDLKTIKNYESWLQDDYFDELTREEVRALRGQDQEIEDRFYKDLEFGTAGLRGILGAGTNRMNLYTVRKATQGLANYILSFGKVVSKKGVAIAYDSRHMSTEFSEEAACVLAANGIKAYVFRRLVPTPLLSYAVRALGATAGIMITASHNPSNYNGYKVYWDDGAQVATQRAKEISNEINRLNQYHEIHAMALEEAKKLGLFQYIEKGLEDDYIAAVKSLSLRSESIQEAGQSLKIIYTPLHGTGNLPVKRVLKEIGFQQVYGVLEQECPDPNFSTVKYPNPEEREAFKLAIGLAERAGAELIIGTDPDCDRVGAVVKDQTGEFIVLSGNQIGALLVDYILKGLKEKKTLPVNGVIIKTIVTSEMGAAIAESYGVATLNTLTGFKYIGAKIKDFEETGEYQYLFGYEESYGYLAGTHARDKDAVVASMLICEMAAYYHTLGLNLYQALERLYQRHGYYLEGLKSITLKGKEGIEKIQETLENLRVNPPRELHGRKVQVLEDYLKGEAYDFATGRHYTIELPRENVLKFKLEDEGWVCLRPSGTEPKLKIYTGIKARGLNEGQLELEHLLEAFEEVMGLS